MGHKVFGAPRPGIEYRDRPGAYGIAFDGQGRAAVISCAGYGRFLLGGGMEPGESEVECLRREAMEFGQDLYVQVERCRNQRRQVEIGSRARDIALARYDSNVQTYLIGKISTLDLNDSRVSKDEALRQYIDRLYLYWYYTYQLRSVTLWDFVKDSGIDADFESVVRQ